MPTIVDFRDSKVLAITCTCHLICRNTLHPYKFNCSHDAGGSGIRLNDDPIHEAIQFSWLGPELFRLLPQIGLLGTQLP